MVKTDQPMEEWNDDERNLDEVLDEVGALARSENGETTTNIFLGA